VVQIISNSSDLLTPAEAAPLVGLRWSKAPKDRVSFYRAVHEWSIPHFKLGPRTVKFSRGDLLAWLQSRKVGGTST
jgi:predicted DNA-binding transcriptional regulator AlpA